MTKLIILLLFCFLFGCKTSTTSKHDTTSTITETAVQSDHDFLGEENARNQLQEALQGEGQSFTWDTLIKTSSTAISIAEPILFDAFGKKQILDEKPYEVYLIDGFWYISGTISKGRKGGAFEIILSAKDARIIRLIHYK